MNIELICVGTELLEGKLNTNNAHICEKLNGIGLRVNLEISVPDDRGKLKEVLESSLNRSDILITTGGLGPTFDDFTKDIMAQVLRKKLVFNREVMHRIAAHFVQRNLTMPKNNESQAYVIDGAAVIPNNVGTAPGMIIEETRGGEKKIVILLPGPPMEMNPMMEEKVLPFLKHRFARRLIKTKVLHTCGMTESALYERIKDIVTTEKKMEGNELIFAMLAHLGIVDVKISGSGMDELLIDSMMNKAKKEIYDCIEDYIYGEDHDTLESVLGRLLAKKKLKFAIAESCTGGLVSNLITNVPGSSVYFKGGLVVYSDDVKIKILGVDGATIKKYGAVSGETAEEMASGVKRLYESDLGLAITGIAGPGGGSAKKPVGLVYMALARDNKVICNHCVFTGSRKEIKERVSAFALDMVRRTVCEHSLPQG